MFALVLIMISTALNEASDSIGKDQIAKKRQSMYAMAFLSSSFGVMLFSITISFGAPFTFKLDSLPYFVPRLILEVLLSYLTVRAIVKAERSTFSFIRLITIPLLLLVDLQFHYSISNLQIAGLLLIFLTLALLLGLNTYSRKGALLVFITGVLSVITISLYKYDISHFNSVAAEQGIINSVLIIFFGVMAKYQSNENVLKLLTQPVPALQSFSGGLASVLESFAYSFAPASIIITSKRGLGVFWSILAGRHYFKEVGLWRKLVALVMVVVALVLLTQA